MTKKKGKLLTLWLSSEDKICALCLEVIDDISTASRDHIIPRAVAKLKTFAFPPAEVEESWEEAAVQLTHMVCNIYKGSSTLYHSPEWYRIRRKRKGDIYR